VVVVDEGLIPMDCPDCDDPLEISERMAGRDTRCPNCRAPIRVPDEPILVLKAEAPDDSNWLAWAALAGAAGCGRGPLWAPSAPDRYCLKCGRGPLWAPSAYCWRCQLQL
jgi:hypothetical protein